MYEKPWILDPEYAWFSGICHSYKLLFQFIAFYMFLKISHFRKYWRYMVNLKAQSLGKSLNLKMVGLKLEHLDSGLVKSLITYLFFKTEKKFRKWGKMRPGV